MSSTDGAEKKPDPRPPGRLKPLRDEIKKLEWWLPVPLQRPLLKWLGGRFNPYTEWNHRHRSIFIHVPRTGGTSVARTVNTSAFHFTAARYAAFDRDAYRRYFKFVFVRNPWDRLLSAFTQLYDSRHETFPFEAVIWSRQHLARFGDFEEFVLALRDPAIQRRIMSHGHFRPQIDWISLPGSRRIDMDFVGRFERLSDDFSEVAGRLSIDKELPRINSSSHDDYRKIYTPPMRAIVADLYRADIDAFDYGF